MIEEPKIRKNTPCVYFITDGQGNCKIGVASDVQSRFVTIQVGNACKLRLKRVEYTDTLDEAFEAERQYHAALSPWRVRGEWFEEKAVSDYLAGLQPERLNTTMADLCPEFNICDAIKFFLIGLESKTAEEFASRYDAEMPEYWKEFHRTHMLTENGWEVVNSV